MPTGYTHGIIDGNIKTFPEFAKLCMKAFGACVRMKDDNLDKPYKPQIVSTFYSENIEKSKLKLKKVKALSDDKIIYDHKKYFKKEMTRIEKYIKEAAEARDKLSSMLLDVLKWDPPTPNHAEFKKFMIEQLKTTIEHDGDDTYHKHKLIELRNETKVTINADDIRKKMIADTKNDIDYYAKKMKEEIKRTSKDNKWVEDLLKSL